MTIVKTCGCIFEVKYEIFVMFQIVKALVEKQCDCQITTLRSNNGEEFFFKEFKICCDKHEIQRQYTTPYTAQQNGVVERWNRTVTKMARCMMQNRSILSRFWAEAVFTVVYLLNRSLTIAVKEKNPEEAWSGKKPKVIHLKFFV